MRWYYLGAVKSFYLCQNVYSESRDTMKSLFENVFNVINFSHVKCIDGKLAINDLDLNKIDGLFKYYIKSYNDQIKLYEISENPDEYSEIESYSNDFILSVYTKNFVKQSINDLSNSINKKRDIFFKHINNLKEIYNSEKIVSFDFEYSDNCINCISEIGITIYYPKQDIKENYHFIINELKSVSKRRMHLSKHFKFGESKRVPLFYALSILNHHLDTSDFITGHDLVNEFKILGKYPNWSKVIDTKFCDIIINNRDCYFSLENIMKFYGFKTAFLHNAGNDSNYVMEVILNMYDEIEEKVAVNF